MDPRPVRPPRTLRLTSIALDPEVKRTHLAILMTMLLPRSHGVRNLCTILDLLLQTYTVTSPGQPQLAGPLRVGRSPHLHSGLIEQIQTFDWMVNLGCMSAEMRRLWHRRCLSRVRLGNSHT